MATDLGSIPELFALPPDRVWLNASHQGPLPVVAADAVARMVKWKLEPHHLASSAPFTEVPARLRQVLSALLAEPIERIVLANSSSYGIHLVANGLRLQRGDEVIVAANDFPSDILPWLRLRGEGVIVKQIQPDAAVLTASEIRAELNSRTRVVCLPWVHSFSGHVIDLDEIGELCRSAGVRFVVNGSQGVGGIPLRPADHPIDALTGVGFKWLCGPYGTGYCWLGDEMLDELMPTKLYWLSALTVDDLLAPELDLESVVAPTTAARHDIFGTANFFNFAAFTESVQLVGSTGVAQIHEHNLGLARQLEDGIDPAQFDVMDRGHVGLRSSLVIMRPRLVDVATAFSRLADAGVDVAQRRGSLRFSPHFYNTSDDVELALAALASAGDCRGHLPD